MAKAGFITHHIISAVAGNAEKRRAKATSPAKEVRVIIKVIKHTKTARFLPTLTPALISETVTDANASTQRVSISYCAAASPAIRKDLKKRDIPETQK